MVFESRFSAWLCQTVPRSKNGLICNKLSDVRGKRNYTEPIMPWSATSWFWRYPRTVSTPPRLIFSKGSKASGVSWALILTMIILRGESCCTNWNCPNQAKSPSVPVLLIVASNALIPILNCDRRASIADIGSLSRCCDRYCWYK